MRPWIKKRVLSLSSIASIPALPPLLPPQLPKPVLPVPGQLMPPQSSLFPSDSFLRDSAQPAGTLAQAYLAQGDNYYKTSRFSHAIEAFNAYLAFNPLDVQVLNKRGVAKAAKKDYAGAYADYSQAIAINPRFYNSYLNRGNLWVYLGNLAKRVGQSTLANQHFQLALQDYGQAVRLEPMNSAAYENRAELYSDMGMHTEALQNKAMVIQLQKLMKVPQSLGLPYCPPRVALILANDDYVGQENDLQGGPLHDAESVASVLRRQGFYVMTGYNLTGPQMKQRVSEYVQKLRENPGAVSMVYYSGHGGSVNGNNYLIPTEYTGQMQPGFEENSVSVDSLLKELKFSNSYFNMIFLDACRTPLMSGDTAFKSAKPTLKQWETEPGPGLANTWIEYASRPQMPAIQDRNAGLYTKYLVQFMARPDLNLKEVSMYTSYALESDPVARREGQHARTQTDLSRMEQIAQAFSFARHCANPLPHVRLSSGQLPLNPTNPVSVSF
jgi:tetratricopeptide (TPR) repeat protein